MHAYNLPDLAYRVVTLLDLRRKIPSHSHLLYKVVLETLEAPSIFPIIPSVPLEFKV